MRQYKGSTDRAGRPASGAQKILQPCIRTHASGIRPGGSSNRFALVAVAALVGLPAAGEPTRRDPDTGAATWETQAHGVAFSLTQLLPDQVRAFYVSRGFALAEADVFAGACVYMAVLRNDAAPGEIRFRLADWQVRQGGATHTLRPVDDWLVQWQARGVSEAARIAFRWAQLPPEQSYAPGEWNQGMVATGLAPGSRFDLIARWTVVGQDYEGRLDDVDCSE
jgi:hypothetical protein